MKWVSRELIHFDRVVTPWLIQRFVDPQAEFILVPWGKEDERPEDAIPYAIPGVELAPHDAEATTFDRVMTKYELDDPGLRSMALVIRHGVFKTLLDRDPPDDRAGRLAPGVMAMIEAIMLASASDMETLERSFPVLDALYALLVAENTAIACNHSEPPAGVSDAMWRTAFNCAILLGAREQGKGFDGREPVVRDAVFDARLEAFQQTALSFNPHDQ